MNGKQFNELIENVPKNQNILKYMLATRQKLNQFKRIAVSYSGGSDSDIMLDIIELVKPDDCGEIKYVFFDTGLEWDATLRQIGNAEQRYGIKIESWKAVKPIPVACREHGIPFICKDASEMIDRLQKHNFNWHDDLEDATVEKYGRCKSALDWYYCCRPVDASGRTKYHISRFKLLREFIMTSPPDFKISDRCCDYAKKNVAKEFDKQFKPDLKINGMRLSEGGRRAGSVKNCFSPANEKKPVADYRPLWFWTDEDKQIYKEWRGIQYSDCYEVWGFKRTGCVGCPCSSKAQVELNIAKKYEPNKVKAAYAVFGRSYEYREQYNRYKKLGGQISIFD